MRRSLALVFVAALAALPLSAQADSESDGTGFYARGGFAVAWANTSLALLGSDISNGANVGFNVGGGYRFNSVVALEGDFAFVTGGDISVFGNTIPGAESRAYVGTIDAKLYPLGFGAEDANSLLQPYLRLGVGGGAGQLTNVGGASGTEGTFVARFGAGLDVMVSQRFGLYGDASYYVNSRDTLIGVGALSFGGIIRFN